MISNIFVTRREFLSISALLAGAAVLSACSTSTPAKPATTDNAKKSVVVFFSQTGNTAQIAKHISEAKKIETVELKAADPYVSADLNYNDSSTRATVEQNTPDMRPALEAIPDLNAYDTVYVGYPIWWGKAPRIMCTFVEGCDLSKKTIVPFCTSGSSGIGSSADELASLASSDSKWIDGERFAAGTDAQTVAKWVDGLAF